MRRTLIILILAALVLPQATSAVVTFTQLDDDVFVVSHRVKGIGSRGKAERMVYRKAASLCVAAGYSYFEILDQVSEAGQEDVMANASIRVQLFQDDAEGRIGCERNAEEKYVEQARGKLARIGYQPPPGAYQPPPEAPAEDSAEEPAEESAEAPAEDSAEEPAEDSAEAPAEDSAEEPAGAEGEPKPCTVDQILAMVKAGFSDEQIKAACPDRAQK